MRRMPLTMGGIDLHGIASKICATSNPFCPQAEGAKVFDSDTEKSITFCNRQLITVTTDANGAAAFMISCSPLATFYTATTIVADSVTVWNAGTNGQFYTLYSTSASKWRVVSAGLKFKTTQAWTAAQGYITITEINALGTGFLPALGSLNNGVRAEMKPLRDANFGCVMRPTGMTAQTYNGIATQTFPFTCFLIGVVGASASANVGQIELIINYEFVPNIVSNIGNFSTQAAPNIPRVMDARANAFGNQPLVTVDPTSPQADEGWMQRAIHAVGGIITGASSVVGTGATAYQNLGPAGRGAIKAAGYAMIA